MVVGARKRFPEEIDSLGVYRLDMGGQNKSSEQPDAVAGTASDRVEACDGFSAGHGKNHESSIMMDSEEDSRMVHFLKGVS